MRRLSLLFFTLVFIFAGSWALFAQETEKKEDNPDLAAIESRAAELAAHLSLGANDLIAPITDRAPWERLAQVPTNQRIVAAAEKLLDEPIPECPESLYKEFFQNGNRSNAQRVLGQRTSRIRVLAQAELLENKGRFLPALEAAIRDMCAYPSWVLPAHDRDNAAVYDGRAMNADLCATHLGAGLAIIRRAMHGVLSPEVAALIDENVRRRVLAPYEESIRDKILVGMWWIQCVNNWNPVCHNGTLCAALALEDDPARRAWFLAAAERYVSVYFFRGFTDDGYCSEGIGYWNYGFGNFTELAEIALRVTDGEVNLFDTPKASAAAWFAPKMEVAPGFYAAFADCSLTARPSGLTLALLSRRLGMGLENSGKIAGWPSNTLGDWTATATNCFPPSDGRFDKFASDDSSERPWTGLRTEFAAAGILIVRPPILPNDEKAADPVRDPAQLAAVFKGGHNGELHNHNDLGSYDVLLRKSLMILDPGGERYTRRTFSAQRYEGELLNSFGHPVPRVAGTLQKSGGDAKAVVLEKVFSDERDFFKLDLTSAYPVEGLSSVTRAFEYTRAPLGTPNKIVVTDAATFAEGTPNVLETALIFFSEWEKISENDAHSEIVVRIRHEKDAVRVSVRAEADGNPAAMRLEERIVGENDEQVPNKPKRLGFSSVNPALNITFTTEITPESE